MLRLAKSLAIIHQKMGETTLCNDSQRAESNERRMLLGTNVDVGRIDRIGTEQGGFNNRMQRKRKLLLAPMAAALPFVALAATVFACTNYVGDFWVWGNSSGYDTTGTLAVQVVGLQPPNDPSQAMTQTVNSTHATAKDPDGTAPPTGYCVNGTTHYNGCFKIFTRPTQDSNAYALPAGAYDINAIAIGYSNHTTWLNPSGDCMSWRLPSPVTKVGDATIGSGTTKGLITAAHDASGNSLTVTSGNIAGEYAVPNTTAYIANTGTQEGGVCISDSSSTNGNQAPLTML